MASCFRQSTYDASDVKINDGTSSHWGSRLQGSNEAKTLTYGLNWILNPNVLSLCLIMLILITSSLLRD